MTTYLNAKLNNSDSQQMNITNIEYKQLKKLNIVRKFEEEKL